MTVFCRNSSENRIKTVKLMIYHGGQMFSPVQLPCTTIIAVLGKISVYCGEIMRMKETSNLVFF